MRIKRSRKIDYGTDRTERDLIHFTAARGNPAFTVDLATCPERTPAYGHWRPDGTCGHVEEASDAVA